MGQAVWVRNVRVGPKWVAGEALDLSECGWAGMEMPC